MHDNRAEYTLHDIYMHLRTNYDRSTSYKSNRRMATNIDRNATRKSSCTMAMRAHTRIIYRIIYRSLYVLVRMTCPRTSDTDESSVCWVFASRSESPTSAHCWMTAYTRPSAAVESLLLHTYYNNRGFLCISYVVTLRASAVLHTLRRRR